MNILKRIFGKNKAPKPYYDKKFACEACGADDGACHPVTGMCYHCGEDDFLPVEAFHLGKPFFHALAIVEPETITYFDKEGRQVFDDRGAYWLACNGDVYRNDRNNFYVAYSSPKTQTSCQHQE